MAVALTHSWVGGNETAQTSTVITNGSGSTIPAGTLVVLAVGWDNTSATAPTSTISTVGGGTATAVVDDVQQGASATAGSGVFLSVWVATTTSSVANAATLATVTFSVNATGKRWAAYGFSGLTSTLRGTTGTNGSTGGTPSAATSGTALVAGDVVIGAVVGENSSTPGADADTTNGTWSAMNGGANTGGAAATNVALGIQYKVVTATGVQTYNGTSASDTLGAIFSLQPTPDPAITQAAYRWYDEGTESGSTALAAQDTAVTGDITNGDATGTLRIRLQATTAVAVPATDDFQLQYKRGGDAYDFSNKSGSDAALTSTQTQIAQSFLGDGLPLTQVTFYLSGPLTAPAGTISVALWAHDGGTFGSTGRPTGSPLATSTNSITATTIVSSPAFAAYTFTFDGTFSPSAGTPYFIGPVATGANTNAVSVARDTTSPTHPGNYAFFTTGWNASATSDLIFEVGTWVNISAVSTVAATYDSPNLTNQAATTNRLTGGTGTFVAGKVSEDALMDDLGWGGNNYTELVYALKIKAADVVSGDTLRFRVLRNNTTTEMTYSQTPTINIIQTFPAVTQAAYRFYADGTESGSTALGTQDTAYTANLTSGDVNLQLRTRLQSTTIAALPATDDWQLQWEKNTSGRWSNVGGSSILDGYAAGALAVDALSGIQNLNADVGTSAVGQQFVGQGLPCLGAGFYVGRSPTAPNGTLTAVLYASSAALGNAAAVPTGSALATSAPVSNATLVVSNNWTYFNFDGSFTPLAGTPYFMVVVSTNTGSNNPNIAYDVTSPTHAGVSAAFGGSWVTDTTRDLIFEVYGSASTVVPYNSPNLTALVDRCDVSGTGSNWQLSPTFQIQAQSFIGDGRPLSQVDFDMLVLAGGAPTGSVNAVLYAHSGTYGTSGLPTGSALATSTTTYTPSAFTATAAPFTFDFDGSFTLSAGTPYFIGVQATGSSAAPNVISVRGSTTTSIHSGNRADWNGSTWTLRATTDLSFEVRTTATTNRLTGGTGTFTAGKVSETGLVPDLGWSGNNYTEHVYSITLKAADLANSDTLRFRVLRNGATTGMTYTQVPTIMAQKTLPAMVNIVQTNIARYRSYYY